MAWTSGRPPSGLQTSSSRVGWSCHHPEHRQRTLQPRRLLRRAASPLPGPRSATSGTRPRLRRRGYLAAPAGLPSAAVDPGPDRRPRGSRGRGRCRCRTLPCRRPTSTGGCHLSSSSNSSRRLLGTVASPHRLSRATTATHTLTLLPRTTSKTAGPLRPTTTRTAALPRPTTTTTIRTAGVRRGRRGHRGRLGTTASSMTLWPRSTQPWRNRTLGRGRGTHTGPRLLAVRPRRTTAAPGRPSPPGTTGQEEEEEAGPRARTAATAAPRRPGRRPGRRPLRDHARRRKGQPRWTSPAGRMGSSRAVTLAPGRGLRRRPCAKDGAPLPTRGTPTRRGRASSTTRPRPLSRRGTTSASTTRSTRATRTTSPRGSRRGRESGTRRGTPRTGTGGGTPGTGTGGGAPRRRRLETGEGGRAVETGGGRRV